jgi:hypothetical protein
MMMKKYKINLPGVVSVSQLLMTGFIWLKEAQVIARNERTWANNNL